MPTVFWLSGFFQPQAFLTAVLQKYCRQQKLSIDVVSYHYKVLEMTDESHVTAPPTSGVYVRGLFIEGASWDFQDQLLVESEPLKIYTQMPLVMLSRILTYKFRFG